MYPQGKYKFWYYISVIFISNLSFAMFKKKIKGKNLIWNYMKGLHIIRVENNLLK